MTIQTAAPKRKPYLGVQMEGPIASWYDRSTRGRIPEFSRIAAEVAASLPAGSRVLEVAPGPGFLAIELPSSATPWQASTSASRSSRSPTETPATLA